MSSPCEHAERICQICGDPLGDEALVTCSLCGTPHHEACWTYGGKCSTYGCGSRLCRRGGEDLPEGPLLRIEGEALATECEDPHALPPEDTGTNLALPITRLDLDTPLESTVSLLAVLAGLGSLSSCVGIVAEGDWHLWYLPFVFAGVTYLFARIRGAIDCTYVIDNVHRRIDYVRKVGGHLTRRRTCDFSEISHVTVRGTHQRSKSRSWWEYEVVLVLRDGRILPVTDGKEDMLDAYRTLACQLATHVGARYDRGSPETYLTVRKGAGGELVLEHPPHSFLRHVLVPGLAGVVAFIAAILAVVGLLSVLAF